MSTIIKNAAIIFLVHLTSQAFAFEDERPEWLYVELADNSSISSRLDSDLRVVGIANNLVDESVIASLASQFGVSELPSSFVVYEFAGFYFFQQIEGIKYILLETQYDYYENSQLDEYQLMILDDDFTMAAFSSSHPDIVDYSNSMEPMLLGLIRHSGVSDGLNLQSDRVSTIVNRDMRSNLMTGGGQCEPMCTNVFKFSQIN